MKQLTSLWDLKSTRGVADVRVSARIVPLNEKLCREQGGKDSECK